MQGRTLDGEHHGITSDHDDSDESSDDDDGQSRIKDEGF
jgi:hypothetical protein